MYWYLLKCNKTLQIYIGCKTQYHVLLAFCINSQSIAQCMLCPGPVVWQYLYASGSVRFWLSYICYLHATLSSYLLAIYEIKLFLSVDNLHIEFFPGINCSLTLCVLMMLVGAYEALALFCYYYTIFILHQ